MFVSFLFVFHCTSYINTDSVDEGIPSLLHYCILIGCYCCSCNNFGQFLTYKMPVGGGQWREIARSCIQDLVYPDDRNPVWTQNISWRYNYAFIPIKSLLVESIEYWSFSYILHWILFRCQPGPLLQATKPSNHSGGLLHQRAAMVSLYPHWGAENG